MFRRNVKASIIRTARVGELGTMLAVTAILVKLTLFLIYRFLWPWWWRHKVHPKCRFLQEPHGVTSQQTTFFISLNMSNYFWTSGWFTCANTKVSALQFVCFLELRYWLYLKLKPQNTNIYSSLSQMSLSILSILQKIIKSKIKNMYFMYVLILEKAFSL
jgi:hypothetical protein